MGRFKKPATTPQKTQVPKGPGNLFSSERGEVAIALLAIGFILTAIWSNVTARRSAEEMPSIPAGACVGPLAQTDQTDQIKC